MSGGDRPAGLREPPADLAILAGTEVFRGLPPEPLAEVRAAASRRRLVRGEILFHQDDPAAGFYVIVVGRLKVTRTAADGQQIILRYLGPGQLAGYAAVAGQTYVGTAAAMEDSHLLGWTRDAIQALMVRHSRIAMNALAAVGARYQDTQERLRELSTERVERRIAHALLRLARQAGRRTAAGIEIAFPVSRQDLAEMSGSTLHTVSRTLSGWEERGIVSSGRRRILIARPQALGQLAEHDAEPADP